MKGCRYQQMKYPKSWGYWTETRMRLFKCRSLSTGKITGYAVQYHKGGFGAVVSRMISWSPPSDMQQRDFPVGSGTSRQALAKAKKWGAELSEGKY